MNICIYSIELCHLIIRLAAAANATRYNQACSAAAALQRQMSEVTAGNVGQHGTQDTVATTAHTAHTAVAVAADPFVSNAAGPSNLS